MHRLDPDTNREPDGREVVAQLPELLLPVGWRQRWTYALLSLGAVLLLIFFSPALLVAFGVLGVNSLQAAWMLMAFLVGPPLFLVLVVAAGLSLTGLIRGPARLRLHVAVWWTLLVGGFAAAEATAPKVGFNPYLGTPHPGLGVSDVILAVVLVLGVVLPQVWKIRASETVPHVRREAGV